MIRLQPVSMKNIHPSNQHNLKRDVMSGPAMGIIQRIADALIFMVTVKYPNKNIHKKSSKKNYRFNFVPVLAVLLAIIITQSALVTNGWAADTNENGATEKSEKSEKSPPPKAGPQQPAPVVTVALITKKSVNPPMEHVGRVVALQAVDLQARVQGTLKEVKFKEGADVKAGETLFIIEQDAYRSQVKADQARVAEAKAALRKAEQYRKRLESVQKGGISKTEIETARADEEQAQAALEVSNATLALSKLNLDYTVIEAPISGRIGITHYTKGNLVGPTSGTLARIVQMDPVRVQYAVSEREVITVQQELKKKGINMKDMEKLGETIIPKIKLSNGTMYDLPGKIDFTANEIDVNTGTLPIYAVFSNPDQLLRPGQFVNVEITATNPKIKPVVPQAAVLEDAEGPYVFVVTPKKQVQPRHIKVGVALETEWAVEEGLMAGETIVVSGIQKIRPGMTVETIFAKK